VKSLNPYLYIIICIVSGATTLANAGPLPSDLASECASPKPGWIWCEDFEIDRSSDYFEGSANRQAGTGVNGSKAGAFTFASNSSSAGGIKIAFGRTPSSYFRAVDNGSSDYRDIYWRMFIYLPDDWVGNGADKLSRATIFADANWSQAMIAHVWSGGDPGSQAEFLLLDPASGTDLAGNLLTTKYNDFSNIRWLGIKSSKFPVFAQQNFGKWHCVEAHVKLNDPGQSNGIFQLYINNNLETEHDALNWVGNYTAYGINAVLFENYWNAGSPVTQTRYFDNLLISTQRIGCGGNGLAPPMPPTNLN
jgi:Polysaccharide lyase 14